MRRFFSRGKDSNGNSGQSNNSKDQPDSTKKSSNSNASATKPTYRQTEYASLSPARPNGLANQPVHLDQAGPVTPSKQVAFAVKTLPATPESFHRIQQQEYEDVHSQVSYHGGTASPAPGTCSTGLGLSCFPNSTTDTKNASSNAVHTHNLLPVPSQPVRHASLDRSSSARDRDRDATLRASSSTGMAQSPTSPTRGEIPQFGMANINKQLPLQQLPPSQQRSGTSMSQNTSVSTSSSLLDARQAFYGSNNSSPNGLDRAYHPNLAILATYSRDMSSVNSNNSGHNSIMQHLTWSEITDEQLVENLGGRERTRQEVLFEMVCSEERYVQELIALKENYLQPLLERHSLSSTHFPSTRDPALSSSALRSLSSPSTSIDASNYHSATIKSTTSIDAARRPFLSLSTGSTSSGLRYASPIPSTSEHGHGHGFASSSSRAGHHRALETHPAASSDHLPIAARFARRISVDSPPAVESSDPGHGNERGSTNTTRTAVDENSPSLVNHGRRDISGGSGMTAVDSGEETNATSHGKAHTQMKKNHTKSRLHPLFSTLTSSARAAGKDNANSARNLNGSSTSIDVPPPLPAKTFKHHLKSLVPPTPNKLHKISSPDLKAGNALAGPGWVVKSLPEDLKIVANVVMEEILNGHQTLSEKLRARYEEQFPLVRTLADVFHDQAWMTEHYATYVLHLERALADIDETLALMNPLLASNRKVKSKDKEAIKEQKILAKIIMHLEEEAALKGAPGLSICISQPFQRLLKYPLLFQSLLYHTDPSTRDYDATQKLAFQIDAIVRSIENEKASEEDRSKTRDVWARIEGINDRALLSPRPDRLLVSEAAMWSLSLAGDSAVAAGRRTFSDASRRVDEAQLQAATAASKKKTARRLSDMTGIGGSSSDKKKKQPSIGSKRDVWLVTFTDVVIRCQRVGVTKLPMQSALASTGSSKITSKENHRKTVLLTTRERNLYKFQKVDRWIMEDKTSPGRAGIVSMDAMARNSRRASGKSDEDAVRPEGEDFEELEVEGRGDIQKVKFEREGDAGMNMDGGESRMSFAYSGDEPRPVIFDIDPLVGGLKLEETPPKGKSTVKATSPRAVVAASVSTQQAVHKKGLAAAKFSNRLRPSTAESSNLQQARRAASPSRTTQHPPRSASAAHDRERGGFSKPTAASLAKASPSTSTFLAAGAGNTTNTNRLPRANESRSVTPDAKRVRAASSNASHRSIRPSTSGAPMPPGLASPSKGTVRERRNSLPSSQGGSGARPLRTKHSSEKLGRRAMMESDTESGVALFN